MSIKVLVSGAVGRMGREVVKAVVNDEQTQLVGAVDRNLVGQDAGEIAGVGQQGILIAGDLATALKESGAQVAVDFSTPHAVRENTGPASCWPPV